MKMTAHNARSLVGRAVVSVADGEKVGAISDMQVDLGQRVVLGLLIGGDGGLFAFEKLGEIAEAVREINADYRKQSRAARAVAREVFAAETGLGELLDRAGSQG